MNLTAALANCRDHLGDTLAAPLQTWPDDQLTLWINQSISSYNVHFPRRMNASIDATAGTREYDLPDNFHNLISLEYQPLGVSTSPPTWYKRHDYMLEDFYTTDKVYDIIKVDNSDAALVPSRVVVNPVTAADADTYYVEYFGDHPQVTLGADIITIPDRHLHLVYLYVRWCAIQELSTGVKRYAYVSGGGGTFEQPYSEIDLKRTLDAYLTALNAARKAESEGVTVHWKMDKHGRVY